MSKEIKNVGELIQELRTKNNLSTTELADKMYISRQAIHYWEKERNKIAMETFTTLTNVLGESVLIQNGKFTILEDNTMENKEQLILDFANFDIAQIENEAKEKELTHRNELSQKCVRISKELENQGYDVYMNTCWDPTLWRKEFCDDGVVISVEKDNKCMHIEIDKSSSMDLFDLDAFIKDVYNEYGKGVAEHIKKSICFTAYNLGLGESIYNCFKKNKSKDSILNLIPTLKGFEDIIHSQLKGSETYFVELNGTIFNNDFPLSYRLNICDDFCDDYIWIKLENEDGDIRYEEESFDTPAIADALEYIQNNFHEFDKLFENANE